MSGIYNSKDDGFSFSRKKESNIYKGTNNDFDFRKSGSTGIYAPSRNSFDFKRSGQAYDKDQTYPSAAKRTQRAAGGAVTQPAMPMGPTAAPNAMGMGDERNQSNLPFKNMQ